MSDCARCACSEPAVKGWRFCAEHGGGKPRRLQWARCAVPRVQCAAHGRLDCCVETFKVPCPQCGDPTASLFGFDDEPGGCVHCGWPQEPRLDDALTALKAALA